MALVDEVREICRRLAPQGWAELLGHHGLDIMATDLRQELSKELPDIDRSVIGFEDFASEGRRGIEPGQPARSLLYHALASPNVLFGVEGEPLNEFPKLAEIKAVENYVFGIEPPSLADVTSRFPGTPIAIAVFASEYRPGAETVHRRHADLCFSRTGVARVGTAQAHYIEQRRGFVPFVEDNEHAFRVLPAQYAPYIAVELQGNKSLFGPMDFQKPEVLENGESDDNRQFWVPVHKLFTGTECVRDLDLSVNLNAHHVNEKIRRIHLHLGSESEWSEPDIDQAPFFFTEGIAEFAENSEFGDGVLAPVEHEGLVEPAVFKEKPLTFKVPPDRVGGLGPTMNIPPGPTDEPRSFPPRSAPEFVHVRHRVDRDGTTHDLNDEIDVVDQTRAGGYQARHHVDFTGDGWVQAVCPELAGQIPRNMSAYSMVTAPDFYPSCEQRELNEWWKQRVPHDMQEEIWETPPLPLSDTRDAPNLQLKSAGFQPEDKTVTAIVSMPATDHRTKRSLVEPTVIRHSHLPDAAAGYFAPGWDTSVDKTDGTTHLAAYGLGSPFPEDAKLCAALSAFWPAVAPDITRSFWPKVNPERYGRTITPMTDEEVGSVGDLPWDGVPGPHPVSDGDASVIEYASFDHVDYVNSALGGRFSLALTAKVNLEEYVARILAMARTYAALRQLGLGEPEEDGWSVVSFCSVAADDEELQQATAETGMHPSDPCYRVVLVRHDGTRVPHDDHRRVRLKVLETITLFVNVLPAVLIKKNSELWRTITTP